MMAIHPETEEPGFEHDVNELPEGQKRHEDSLEEAPTPEEKADAMEDVQEEAAEERKEGGYQ
jgi:hypothetical protein